MTADPSPIPQSAAESELPVVAWIRDGQNVVISDPVPLKWYPEKWKPLVRLSDAQAIIADLRSQIDRLTGERDEARESERQVCEQYDAMAGEFKILTAELDSLRAPISEANELPPLPTPYPFNVMVPGFPLYCESDLKAYARDALRAAAGDAARLDWLERTKQFPLICWNARQGRQDSFNGFTFRASCKDGTSLSLRDAIDAAMAPAADGEK